MGLDDKMKNAAEEAGGKVKETVGEVTDNERLEAEGKADQFGANLKQAGENVKDAFRQRLTANARHEGVIRVGGWPRSDQRVAD